PPLPPPFLCSDPPPPPTYTLSLHDALPISPWVTTAILNPAELAANAAAAGDPSTVSPAAAAPPLRNNPLRVSWVNSSSMRSSIRSEEHTSELQSLAYLVCRLLLEKKKNKTR